MIQLLEVLAMLWGFLLSLIPGTIYLLASTIAVWFTWKTGHMRQEKALRSARVRWDHTQKTLEGFESVEMQTTEWANTFFRQVWIPVLEPQLAEIAKASAQQALQKVNSPLCALDLARTCLRELVATCTSILLQGAHGLEGAKAGILLQGAHGLEGDMAGILLQGAHGLEGAMAGILLQGAHGLEGAMAGILLQGAHGLEGAKAGILLQGAHGLEGDMAGILLQGAHGLEGAMAGILLQGSHGLEGATAGILLQGAHGLEGAMAASSFKQHTAVTAPWPASSFKEHTALKAPWPASSFKERTASKAPWPASSFKEHTALKAPWPASSFKERTASKAPWPASSVKEHTASKAPWPASSFKEHTALKAPWHEVAKLQSKSGSLYVKDARVEEFTLGAVPPVFKAATIRHNRAKEYLQFEMDMSFITVGFSSVLEMRVQPHKFLPLFALRMEAENVAVSGRLLLGFHLIDRPPGVAGVDVSFVERPRMDIEFKPLGLPLSQVPGVAQWLNEIVSSQVDKMFVEPKRDYVDTESIYSKYLAQTKGGAEGVLVVMLDSCRNLDRMADADRCNPYCEVRFGGNVLRTKIARSTVDPDFKSHFNFPVHSKTAKDVVKIRCLDWDAVGEPEIIGKCDLALKWNDIPVKAKSSVKPLEMVMPFERGKGTLNVRLLVLAPVEKQQSKTSKSRQELPSGLPLKSPLNTGDAESPLESRVSETKAQQTPPHTSHVTRSMRGVSSPDSEDQRSADAVCPGTADTSKSAGTNSLNLLLQIAELEQALKREHNTAQETEAKLAAKISRLEERLTAEQHRRKCEELRQLIEGAPFIMHPSTVRGRKVRHVWYNVTEGVIRWAPVSKTLGQHPGLGASKGESGECKKILVSEIKKVHQGNAYFRSSLRSTQVRSKSAWSKKSIFGRVSWEVEDEPKKSTVVDSHNCFSLVLREGNSAGAESINLELPESGNGRGIQEWVSAFTRIITDGQNDAAVVPSKLKMDLSGLLGDQANVMP
ncbi:hypothetical protein CYMTET_9048 [Cymbomonas tetramitiformis]|uniref:Uncharacterized protein n=1 Tax=Cymbomonas tetramitiformis TaxID=36881 RepID=A0AAE0LFF0_9CHLO|nr:hypothetical protein CYMTET_9048 [Cymbomonas tetramitiformis]